MELEKIKNYLLEKTDNEIVAKKILEKFIMNDDIAHEFAYYLDNGKFIQDNPVNEQGYTAEKLYNEYHDRLDISGVFAFLVTLRTDPEKALETIKNNFPIK